MNYIDKYYQQLKSWYENEALLGPTATDEYYYREMGELTPSQKLHILEMEEEKKRLSTDSDFLKSWMERQCEDKTDRDIKLW